MLWLLLFISFLLVLIFVCWCYAGNFYLLSLLLTLLLLPLLLKHNETSPLLLFLLLICNSPYYKTSTIFFSSPSTHSYFPTPHPLSTSLFYNSYKSIQTPFYFISFFTTFVNWFMYVFAGRLNLFIGGLLKRNYRKWWPASLARCVNRGSLKVNGEYDDGRVCVWLWFLLLSLIQDDWYLLILLSVW